LSESSIRIAPSGVQMPRRRGDTHPGGAQPNVNDV
jgi:hypothetical protein